MSPQSRPGDRRAGDQRRARAARSRWPLSYRAVTAVAEPAGVALVTRVIRQLGLPVAADHRVVRVVVDHGFDWRAAAIGAAVATGIGLVGLGLWRERNRLKGDR